MAHVAAFPETETFAQIAFAPSLNVTVPAPGLGLIVAVKVTELPYVLGVPEVANAVVVFWTALLKCA